MSHRWSAALAGPLALLLLTACTQPPDTASTTPPAVAAPAPTAAVDATPTATPTPTARLAEPTCHNIMSASFTTSWLPVEITEPSGAFSEGIQCRWQADLSVGTDNILAYGWTPAEQADWDALIAETDEEGSTWFVEPGERGQYLTHKTEYWVQDDDGYGATYLFTGDAIIYAMTKAETYDVKGPPIAHG